MVLAEPEPLTTWTRIRRPIASELIRVECLRTVDRARLRFDLSAPEVARRRASILGVLDRFELVPVDSAVLTRAAEPFPTLVSTLDALHLASALLAREGIPDLALATHDAELGTAARALGFPVHGVAME